MRWRLQHTPDADGYPSAEDDLSVNGRGPLLGRAGLSGRGLVGVSAVPPSSAEGVGGWGVGGFDGGCDAGEGAGDGADGRGGEEDGGVDGGCPGSCDGDGDDGDESDDGGVTPGSRTGWLWDHATAVASKSMGLR